MLRQSITAETDGTNGPHGAEGTTMNYAEHAAQIRANLPAEDPSGAQYAARHAAYAARTAVKPVQAMPTLQFSSEAARLVLRGLACNGVTIVRQARAAHGSDCAWCDKTGPMRHCRCVRAMRLRTARNGDWLLVFGDYQEGPAFKLSGPYANDATLTYGGGFWESVEV